MFQIELIQFPQIFQKIFRNFLAIYFQIIKKFKYYNHLYNGRKVEPIYLLKLN